MRFLSIGRYLERGLHMTGLLGHMSGPEAPDGAYNMLLEIGDSVMTHRRRYNVNTAAPTVTDLLALDPLNPRSVLYQLTRSRKRSSSCRMPSSTADVTVLIARRCGFIPGLPIMTPEQMDMAVYRRLMQDLERLSELLAQTYLG